MSADRPMATVCRCRCDHAKRSHKYEAGFYDVRGGYFDCTVIGCPCTRYEPTGARR